MNATQLVCRTAPNYVVCATYQTLITLMDGYYPIVETVATRLTDPPTFAIAVSGACVLVALAGSLVCRVLHILVGSTRGQPTSTSKATRPT